MSLPALPPGHKSPTEQQNYCRYELFPPAPEVSQAESLVGLPEGLQVESPAELPAAWKVVSAVAWAE